MGSMPGPNQVMTKGMKSGSTDALSDATQIVRVPSTIGLGPKQAQLITLHSQLGLPDKGHSIKELIVCILVRIYEVNGS